MEERQVLHVLVDGLPEDELVAAKSFLEYLRFRSRDPLRVLLNGAPFDDEQMTEEDLAAIRKSLGKLSLMRKLSASSWPDGEVPIVSPPASFPPIPNLSLLDSLDIEYTFLLTDTEQGIMHVGYDRKMPSAHSRNARTM